MGCDPGGTAGNAYYRVDLDAPTTTVTVQDIDPGGGSGYSFMMAECLEEEPAVCCDSLAGPTIVATDQCAAADVLPDAACAPVDVCCISKGDPVVVSSDQCDPTDVLPWTDCEVEPPEDPVCVHYTAIDMGSLPYTLNTGETLQSYLGSGPYTGVPSSNGCSTVPIDGMRGYAGVGTDGPVVFDTPISSFYILQLNVQDGDDLTFAEPNTITPVACDPGGIAGDAYYKVDLDTPTTTVTVQDIDPGGGSGYSFMMAECSEWSTD